MNATLARTYASKSVLLAAAAGVIWFFTVRPMTDELRQAKAAIDSFGAEIDQHTKQFGSTPFPAEAIANELRARRADLEASFRASSNPAQVYDSLGVLAASVGVRLERVEPGKGGRGVVSQCPEIVNSAVHSIEATGTMSQLADFFSAIDTRLGMSRVTSVRLAPVPGADGQQLTATIETTHLRLAERNDKTSAKASGKTSAKTGSSAGATAPAPKEHRP